MFIKRISSIKHAISGILYAINNDSGFRSHLIFGLPIIAVIVYLAKPLNELEIVLAVMAYLLILITELQNSAFENALDKIHPDKDPAIGRSKDMAAGAVLLAGLFALGVAIYAIWF